MHNILCVVCVFRIVAAVSLLRQRVNNLRTLVDPLSVDDVWVNPPPALNRASTDINRMVDEIDEITQYEVCTYMYNTKLSHFH